MAYAAHLRPLPPSPATRRSTDPSGSRSAPRISCRTSWCARRNSCMPEMKFSRSASLNQSDSIIFTNSGTPAASAPPVSVVGMINSDTSPMRVQSSAVIGVAGDFAARPGTVSDRPNSSPVAQCRADRANVVPARAIPAPVSSRTFRARTHARFFLTSPTRIENRTLLEYRTGTAANQHQIRRGRLLAAHG